MINMGTQDNVAGPNGGCASAFAGGNGRVPSAASYFPCSMYFNQRIDKMNVDSQSSAIIANLQAKFPKWGAGSGFTSGASGSTIDIFYSTPEATRWGFDNTSTNQNIPDSDLIDSVPTSFGTLSPSHSVTPGYESTTGAYCDGGDCHYLVLDSQRRQFVEIVQSDWAGSGSRPFNANAGQYAGELVLWPYDQTSSAYKSFYPLPSGGSLRGDGCNGADASGALMAPLLFSPDEVATGAINHAIRFILPNSVIYNSHTRVWPATHAAGSVALGASAAVPYGARFRLRADYPTAGLTAGEKVLVAALQQYGMILSDGGRVALTPQSDTSTLSKWGAGTIDLDNTSLNNIAPRDFVMIDGGPRISSGDNCNRNQVTSGPNGLTGY